MTGDGSIDDRERRLLARVARERLAREEAERLLECKSLALYQANQALSAAAAELEARVAERTRELDDERLRAIRQAERDALTGIPNRAAFAQALRGALADPHIRAGGVAVLLIDLDDFKKVNDSQGHAAGDALLVEVAHRLVLGVRPGDLVARLGGDEFAVLACELQPGAAAQALAQRLLKALCVPVLVEGRTVPCASSIGMAVLGSTDSLDLLRDADMALYASKRAGRGCVTVFEPDMRAAQERRSALEDEVRAAVAGRHIEPWYQPVLRRSSGQFAGAELLARWRLASGEVRTPAAFLDTVESLGLLDTMMENMLRCALPEAAAAIGQGRLHYLTINVSPNQFNQGWALRAVPALLAETGFPPHALVVELTETALVRDMAHTRQMLAALRSAGMRIAIDDFGVGYSNFSLLRQLPFDMLKLDRSLICDIETDHQALALAECVLALAQRLRIRVVAEGVETRGQAELLARAGCASMQGWWFARPQRDLATWFAPGATTPSVPWASRG